MGHVAVWGVIMGQAAGVFPVSVRLVAVVVSWEAGAFVGAAAPGSAA
jgi:hypothetical protein